MNSTFLFLHDTPLSLKRGAEYSISLKMAYAEQHGMAVDFYQLKDFEVCKKKIQQADFVIVNSTIRAPFQTELFEYLFQHNIPYAKIEYDYNFCTRRNILCTVDRSIRNCCNTENYHLYREVFNNAQVVYFQSPEHKKSHQYFYGDVVADAKVIPPLVALNNLQKSTEKQDHTISFFGDLNYLKGGNAFVEYAERHPEKTFHVYGRNQLRRKIPDNLQFFEPIDNIEVLKILSQSKYLFSQPVWPEPSGRLVAEAFLSGCEIIGNDRIGTFSFDFYPDHPQQAREEIEQAIPEFWNSILSLSQSPISKKKPPKKESVLVYKSYGGLGDIFFTIPTLYQLKDRFNQVSFVVEERLYEFFTTHLQGFTILKRNEAPALESQYTEVVELGNYPHFKNEKTHLTELPYPTNKKVKQHSIGHYKDGVLRLDKDMQKYNDRFPYFPKSTSHSKYYTLHAGAGFLLKAWPVEYYVQFIQLMQQWYPELECVIIKGPNDPNPKDYLTENLDKIHLEDGDLMAVGKAVSAAVFHVGNDAGITHLAGAFNIPILAIYGPTGPGSWGPFSTHNEIIWGKAGNCNLRCNYEVIINCKDRVCLNKVSPLQMMFSALKLLQKIGYSEGDMLMLNPNFTVTQEANSFLFKDQNNEYLIEVKDEEGSQFISNWLHTTFVSRELVPKPLLEVIEAFQELELVISLPQLSK